MKIENEMEMHYGQFSISNKKQKNPNDTPNPSNKCSPFNALS